MISAVLLLHEPKRKRPWVVRWYGEPDWNTGKQRRYGRSFRHSREPKAFLAEKEAGLDDGAPRDPPQNVTLSRLIAEFEEARLATLSFASQQAYRNTIAQLVSTSAAFGPSAAYSGDTLRRSWPAGRDATGDRASCHRGHTTTIESTVAASSARLLNGVTSLRIRSFRRPIAADRHFASRSRSHGRGIISNQTSSGLYWA